MIPISEAFKTFVSRIQHVMARRSEEASLVYLQPEYTSETQAICHLITYGLRPGHLEIMIAKLVETLARDYPEPEYIALKKVCDEILGSTQSSTINHGLH